MSQTQREAHCPAEYALDIIGGRWKVVIHWHLSHGIQRFSELKRNLNGISTKMLTQQLREMEADGLIHREIYKQVPPKVEYSLTPLGESLQPIVEAMCQWGIQHGQPCPQARNIAAKEAAAREAAARATLPGQEPTPIIKTEELVTI